MYKQGWRRQEQHHSRLQDGRVTLHPSCLPSAKQIDLAGAGSDVMLPFDVEIPAELIVGAGNLHRVLRSWGLSGQTQLNVEVEARFVEQQPA